MEMVPLATRRRASLYISGVWIRQPKGLNWDGDGEDRDRDDCYVTVAGAPGLWS